MTPRKHLFTFIYLFLHWFFFNVFSHLQVADQLRLRVSYCAKGDDAEAELTPGQFFWNQPKTEETRHFFDGDVAAWKNTSSRLLC